MSQETQQWTNFNDSLTDLTKWQLDLMLFLPIKFHINVANVKHFAGALLKYDFIPSQIPHEINKTVNKGQVSQFLKESCNLGTK